MRQRHAETRPLRQRRFRAFVWILLTMVVTSMALPATGYLWVAVQDARAQDQPRQAEEANPRSEYWREVREGNEGYTAVTGQETDVLIQNGGQIWREARNGPIAGIGAVMVIAVILALAAYHLAKGGNKLEKRTGRTVVRWPLFDRVIHWYTAVLFVIMAITGMSLLWGRAVLIPVFGKPGFAAWAQLAIWIHNYLALFFIAGLLVMLVAWFRENLFKSYDLEWFRKLGGYLGGGHAPAGFANAGEKVWYWTLVFAGGALVISGFYLLFPNFGFERDTMQLSNVVHNIAAMGLIAFAVLHIYLGTLGSEGVFEGMWTGEVDEGWAQQHHDRWFEEVKKEGQTKTERPSPGQSTATSH